MKIIFYTMATAILLSIILSSCEYINSLNKTTENSIVEFQADTIKQVFIDASCRLVLSEQTGSSVILSGQQHLVKNFELNYEDESLNISHKTNTLQKTKLVEITIPADFIEKITTNSPCEIVTRENIGIQTLILIMNGSSQYTESDLNLTSKKLEIFCYGNSNIGQHHLEGQTDELKLHLEGRIKIDALALSARSVNLTNKSSYDTYVFVNSLLRADIYSSGNIYYSGNPEVIFKRYHVPYLNSTGEIIQLN